MAPAKRAIVTGATGLLGRAVVKEFERCTWSVQGWGFNRADGVRAKKVDVTAKPEVSQALESFRPDVIIHAAAERHPDVIERNPEGAHDLNVGATEFLAKECARLSIKFVYISTDYVFDGTAPPYSASSKPNPLNAYGETKLLGEIATASASESHVILRIPILFGHVEQLDESAVTVLFKSLRDVSKPCKMDDVQLRYPTHVDHVAVALAQFCGLYFQAKAENGDSEAPFSGIFHFSAAERYTKYEMVMAMAKTQRMDASHVIADKSTAKSTTSAKRPHNAQLSCDDLQRLGISVHSDFRQEIKSVLEPFL